MATIQERAAQKAKLFSPAQLARAICDEQSAARRQRDHLRSIAAPVLGNATLAAMEEEIEVLRLAAKIAAGLVKV